MIPERIDRYLRAHHPGCAHTTHLRTVAAQRLAAAEHVSGTRVAKTVVVSLDGALVLAVVGADRVVDLDVLRAASGAAQAGFVPEAAFARRFEPCEAGAEPPLGVFGLPIYVDAALAQQPWIVMRGGTHEDAVRLRTDEWLREEHAAVVDELGRART
ncbi:aminoacyl-tRNA deacylase [Anaeromyxobacter dehalogenans]|uniref:YbaK/prolyl-tRNA synthetase associated region n=1 Tax=Anaeromyxobacter dehalogenans (strain 2CP-C) TaxID=290397 RepID=Q2INZ9_ANADE|nr:YbaK/EbsC family protein [Anaeromyxobacter dehalogenans]ABC80532.1 YbaK/prolyl-tRNA synthetase associated region [Anaeromyxobacter dehalogenans 2CP-C]